MINIKFYEDIEKVLGKATEFNDKFKNTYIKLMNNYLKCKEPDEETPYGDLTSIKYYAYIVSNLDRLDTEDKMIKYYIQSVIMDIYFADCLSDEEISQDFHSFSIDLAEVSTIYECIELDDFFDEEFYEMLNNMGFSDTEIKNLTNNYD